MLDQVLETLERHGVAFMVTGSLAGNLHGLPRATQDADVVVEGGLLQIDHFVAELGGTFYASRDAARDAFEHWATDLGIGDLLQRLLTGAGS